MQNQPFTALWIDNSDGLGPIRNPDLTDEEFAAGIESIRASNVSMLWQAAHDYEFTQISGTAAGLLAVGVQRGGPVATAIQDWCNRVWGLYYQRKPLVTEVYDASFQDFTPAGPIPYSIPDLMAEVYAAPPAQA